MITVNRFNLLARFETDATPGTYFGNALHVPTPTNIEVEFDLGNDTPLVRQLMRFVTHRPCMTVFCHAFR